MCNDNLCIKKDEDCPISDIFVSIDRNLQDSLTKEYIKLEFSTNYYLYYRAGAEFEAVTSFIVDNDIPCLNKNYYPLDYED